MYEEPTIDAWPGGRIPVQSLDLAQERGTTPYELDEKNLFLTPTASWLRLRLVGSHFSPSSIFEGHRVQFR